MTGKNAKRSIPWQDSGPRLCSEIVESAPSHASFHASLRDCAKKNVEQKSPRAKHAPSRSRWTSKPRGQRTTLTERAATWLRAQYASWAAKQLQTARSVSLVKNSRPNLRPDSSQDKKPNQPKRPSKGILSQIWSWVQSRYSLSSTKRLRVGEIAQLGEKRFVALVTVEGREFLIGGGSTGISLLTPLGAAPQSGEPIQAKLEVGGDSE
jgi:hypothetical protein